MEVMLLDLKLLFLLGLVYIAYGKERAAAPTFLELISRSFVVDHVPDEDLAGSKDLDLTFTIAIVKLTRK